MGYGVDKPRVIIALFIAGVLSAAIGILLAVYTESSGLGVSRLSLLAGLALGFLFLVVAFTLYWSNSKRKINEIQKIVGSIPWGGNEVALDLGCGRGLGMVTAARMLTNGYAVGVDVWKKSHVSGNDPRSIWANAAEQGVDGRVSAVRANLVALPFVDSSIDVVVSAVAIHRLVPKNNRGALFEEISRVLKDGGRVGILEAGNGSEYTLRLRELGMSDVTMQVLRLSSFPPFHIIMARKPFRG